MHETHQTTPGTVGPIRALTGPAGPAGLAGAALKRCRGDRGSAAFELVVLTPILFGVLGFVLFAARTTSVRQTLEQASRDAARTASHQPTPARASAAATEAVNATLANHRITCAALDVTTDTNRFQPGGVVAVEVTCTIKIADLTGLPLPADRRITTRSAEVIDTYADHQP